MCYFLTVAVRAADVSLLTSAIPRGMALVDKADAIIKYLGGGTAFVEFGAIVGASRSNAIAILLMAPLLGQEILRIGDMARPNRFSRVCNG
jgi:hypothetical protein